MSDEPDNLILSMRRAIRGDLADLKTGQIEIKERLGLLEETCASLSRRVDRIDLRLDRIERRLDLTDAPA
jgi:hypothetical protein